MSDALYEILMKLPKKNIINLMFEALDDMQSWNGRTRMFCVLNNIGATGTETETGSYKWEMPTVAEAKRSTNHSPIF